MVIVGKPDAFERKYMGRFRSLASEFGEFVKYERDRGARDIGVHLTHTLSSGKERVSTALVWFQMKGVMSSTLPLAEFEKLTSISIPLDVKHLRYWYLQPMPTYLALNVESVDKFFILNITDYVRNEWGRNILTLEQNTATVKVPLKSELDRQAFRLILQANDIEEWKKALGSNSENIAVCYRNYNLIWNLGTADERNVTHELEFWDWQSKTRGQLHIYEVTESGKKTLREHLQYRMNINELESSYPYIEFFAKDEDKIDDWLDEEEDNEVPDVVLSNGDVISGVNVNAAYEYFAYNCGIKLNEVGNELFEWVKYLADIGLIEITPGKSECISIAPWHGRAV